MPQKKQRYYLKSKEARSLLNALSEQTGLELEDFFSSKVNIEVAEADFGRIYVIAGKPLFFSINDELFPTLLFKELHLSIPRIIVDMGAIPHVTNGADIMAPGIVRIEGEFERDALVMVVDERHRKPIALGRSLFTSEVSRGTKKGVVVKNIHYVGDKIWNSLKALLD